MHQHHVIHVLRTHAVPCCIADGHGGVHAVKTEEKQDLELERVKWIGFQHLTAYCTTGHLETSRCEIAGLVFSSKIALSKYFC